MTARPLYEVAHSRAGDKGNSLNLSLIPFDEELYDALVEQVTAERVRLHFSGIVEGKSSVTAYPTCQRSTSYWSGPLQAGSQGPWRSTATARR